MLYILVQSRVLKKTYLCELFVRIKNYGFLKNILCETQKTYCPMFFWITVHFTDQIRINPQNGKIAVCQ